jgi:hypothetical protein
MIHIRVKYVCRKRRKARNGPVARDRKAYACLPPDRSVVKHVTPTTALPLQNASAPLLEVHIG